MPKIELKPNSPEYQDESKPKPTQLCDYSGCINEGIHRAPKGRNNEEFYHFCFDHVKEYNSSWDYFDGMTPREIQEEMLKSLYGDRPTWKHENIADSVKDLRNKAWQTYNFSDSDEHTSEDAEERRRKNAFKYHHHTPEYEAMSLLGLEPPLDLDTIKKKYKELVKKHHPDKNGGSAEAEERIKNINTAYTTLKTAFERYEVIVQD